MSTAWRPGARGAHVNAVASLVRFDWPDGVIAGPRAYSDTSVLCCPQQLACTWFWYIDDEGPTSKRVRGYGARDRKNISVTASSVAQLSFPLTRPYFKSVSVSIMAKLGHVLIASTVFNTIMHFVICHAVPVMPKERIV